MAERNLLANLLPYQAEAVDWCKSKENSCCILAYDMGLGKTVISCGLLIAKPMKTLIMVPTSLINQWQSEIEQHTTGLKVLVYHGNRKRLRVQDADVVITTSAVIASEIKVGIYKFRGFKRWIIDEAHKLRNKDSRTFKMLHEYAPMVENKVFLTGTPICNSSNDLVSLICLSNLDPYNDVAMWKHVENPVKYRLLDKIIPDIVLRRTKADTIADLLPKITINTVTLSVVDEGQKDVYNHFTKNSTYIIKQILRMRQSLNHPVEVLDEVAEDGIVLSEIKSIKMDAVKNILSGVPTGDKVIIFSIFTKLLLQMYDGLEIPDGVTRSQYMQLYHGGLHMEDRNKVISQFKSDPDARILLINLRAGGVGLNLVEANHVILMEPYWNEAEQQQAINRVYRLGQTKPISVYKLVVKNSIETWLQSMQKTKNNLSCYFIDRNKQQREADELISQRVTLRELFKKVKDATIPETVEEQKELEESIKELAIPDDSV